MTESQCAFAKGRLIVDCSLMANEFVDEMMKKNRARILC